VAVGRVCHGFTQRRAGIVQTVVELLSHPAFDVRTFTAGRSGHDGPQESFGVSFERRRRVMAELSG
jgi:hypothetical protein